MWESSAMDAGNFCHTHSMQEQGFSLWIAHQRPLQIVEREREEKSALIIEESDSSDIQSEEKKGICSCKTGDSTCCPKASKDLYLQYTTQPKAVLLGISHS
jgi:hypothetical protein